MTEPLIDEQRGGVNDHIKDAAVRCNRDLRGREAYLASLAAVPTYDDGSERDGEERKLQAEKATKVRETHAYIANLEERLTGQDIDPDMIVAAWLERKSIEGIARVIVSADRDKAEAIVVAIQERLAEGDMA